MKAIKLTIIDANAIQNAIDYNDPKVINALKKDRDYSITIVKSAIAKIKFGVVKNGRYFYAVVDGNVIQDSAHVHSTYPITVVTHAAKLAGYNVKD